MITNHRRGFTLVELLVTLAVISALAVIVLPSVKTMLSDRRGSQSAIIVKNYLEAARSRAIASGKPVAVVLERLSSRPFDADENGRIEGAEVGVSGTASTVNPGDDRYTNYIPYNACIRLSMAESPMPVKSESMGLPTNVTIGYSGMPATPVTDATVQTLTPVASFFRVGIYLQTQNGPNNPQDLASRTFIQNNLVAGNEVSFDLNPGKFVIAETGFTTQNGLQMLVLYFLSGNVTLNPTEIAINNLTPTGGSSFTLYPKPRPIAVQNVTLPRGICIDLSVSGFSEPRKLYHFDSSAGITPDPLASVRDYRLRFSSAWVSPNEGLPVTQLPPVPQPGELRPVYIVFNPDGSFGRVFANNQAISPTPARPPATLKMIDAAEDLFLHIGRIDQVNVSTTVPYAGSLADPSNYVVRVSPRSGAVAASPIGAIRPEDLIAGGLLGSSPSLGDCVSLSRKRAFAQFATGQ
jgi:prepilin-type N-terminal cleavage/methylation domain-containing protein